MSFWVGVLVLISIEILVSPIRQSLALFRKKPKPPSCDGCRGCDKGFK
jgi:hypothetical protein